ncbi:zinc ABC transporter substrate-binding protein [Staphylococcus equorum]|jgi:ABC-type Zn uptake system ZnuABC Zn-binding protein ZnuA|uniref:metal ABC transporter substrate-binding protein n=1 Tax=Staphylococcus TaxID=1279 RepID=UPI00085303A8|nr:MULTISPECIES: zinc ABC transporter substrate-binding protein [Staphylococcus]MCQ3817929.1 zinc ABC transporter substrate-binding protein [Staphylococcus xylosus]MCQ3820617.1 zinc ABC transporter substrate-binding protein [Staphylococcus xylosus]MDG0823682.1 zinc ABC transporter substrate-binding protein [Staphylococcus equorum]MDG0838864.1 zinc ABC transporter substrate-binding protein [Staphylococcus equorum]OEK66920.1 zinc ABC transporter substrate-binding protein [Staphylococcus equorum]
MKKAILFLFTITLSILLAACSNGDKGDDSDKNLESVDKDKIKVVTSFSMIEDIVKEIGGEHVEVENLVPTGTDPHDYDPKPDDVKHISSADLVFYNGLNLEGGSQGWLFKALDASDFPRKNAIKTSDGIKPKYIKDEDGNKEINPHAFIDPNVGEQMVRNITESLSERNPKNKDYYKKNEKEYLNNLHNIEDDYKKQLGDIPKKDRVFVASEQAFQYLADSYDLKEGYIWAIDTDENGSPEQIKSLVKFIDKNKPASLFVESNVDKRPMETVSKESGVSIYKKPIYSDEISKKGGVADTYLKYLEYNLDVLTNGLEK